MNLHNRQFLIFDFQIVTTLLILTLLLLTNCASPETTTSSQFQVENQITTQTTLSWSSYPGARAYELIISYDSQFSTFDSVTDITATTCTIKGLHPSTTYYWAVRAVTGTGNDSRGPWISGYFTTDANGNSLSWPREIRQVVKVESCQYNRERKGAGHERQPEETQPVV